MEKRKDKVVIIAGASSGIGEATARALVKNGARVMLSVRREERLQELAQSLGEGAAYLQSDVTQRKDMQRLAQVALARFGKIDALFANAEVMPGSNIRTTTIYPGAVKTELLHTIAPSREKAMVEQFYEEAGLEPDVIANAVLYALFQPDNVDVSDLVVRPSKES